MNRNTLLALGVVVALALFFGGLAVGLTLAPARGAEVAADPAGTAAPGGRRAVGAAGQPGAALGAAGGGLVNGRVLSVQDGSITVEVRQPGGPNATPATTSTIALVGSSTRVVRTAETDIRLSDVKAGDAVTIVGTTDQATGAVSANTVVVGGAFQQLAPGLRQGSGGGQGQRPSPSPSPGR